MQNLPALYGMQTDGTTTFTWTAPPGVIRLSELLIVAGEMNAGQLLKSH
jgi:hypothetical protein